MEKLSEERVREVERRAERDGAWDVVSLARELLALRAGAHDAALAKADAAAARAELARVQGVLDQLAVSPPAVYELVQALIGLLDEHDIPLGDLWSKVDAAGLRQPLVFSGVQPGDQTAGDPATEEGRIACIRQICPSLTMERAKRAADEARRRGLRVTIADTRALIEELFGKFCAPCSHGDHGKCRDARAGGSGPPGMRCGCCYPRQG